MNVNIKEKLNNEIDNAGRRGNNIFRFKFWYLGIFPLIVFFIFLFLLSKVSSIDKVVNIFSTTKIVSVSSLLSPKKLEVSSLSEDFKVTVNNKRALNSVALDAGLFDQEGVIFPFYQGQIDGIAIRIVGTQNPEAQNIFDPDEFNQLSLDYNGEVSPIKAMSVTVIKNEKTLLFDILLDQKTISENNFTDEKISVHISADISTFLENFVKHNNLKDATISWIKYKKIMDELAISNKLPLTVQSN